MWYVSFSRRFPHVRLPDSHAGESCDSTSERRGQLYCPISACHVIPDLVRVEPIANKEPDMRIWRILLFILLALVIVFALQNTQVVDVQFFFWTLSMSRALVLLGTLVIGLFAGWLIGRFTPRP